MLGRAGRIGLAAAALRGDVAGCRRDSGCQPGAYAAITMVCRRGVLDPENVDPDGTPGGAGRERCAVPIRDPPYAYDTRTEEPSMSAGASRDTVTTLQF